MAESLTGVPFEDFIQSDLFTFHVGEEKKTFIVHSNAVAATSPVFDSLVNGGLSESQTRSAEIEDIDPDTFIRFLEYAYRRDYTTPSWTEDSTVATEDVLKNSSDPLNPLPEPDVELPRIEAPTQATGPMGVERIPVNAFSINRRSPHAFPTAFGAIPSATHNKRNNKTLVSLRAAFNQRQYVHSDNNASTLLRLQFEPQSNTSSTQNFASVFLAHARMYTLADVRMVFPLKDLALQKLHKTLVSFELYSERLGDVVELAKYAYEHGQDRSEDGRLDALRDMVVNYVACEKKKLGKHAEFRDLMDGGGEFAGDIWDIVSQEQL